MAEKYHFAYLLRGFEIIDSTLYIECDQFPVYESFVIVEPLFHAEHHQSPLRELRTPGVL